jgi:pyruvate/2-oxoglutarate/acetoin dehydrogenase E1 component
MITEIKTKIKEYVKGFGDALAMRKMLNQAIAEMKKSDDVFMKGERLGGGNAKSEYKVTRDSKGRFVKWKRVNNDE